MVYSKPEWPDSKGTGMTCESRELRHRKIILMFCIGVLAETLQVGPVRLQGSTWLPLLPVDNKWDTSQDLLIFSKSNLTIPDVLKNKSFMH